VINETLILPDALARGSPARSRSANGGIGESDLPVVSSSKNNWKQFKQRYLQLHGSSAGTVPVSIKKPANCKLRRSIVLDHDIPMSGTAKTHINPLKPWLNEFKLYLSTSEIVPEGMDTIAWWGVRKNCIVAVASLLIGYPLAKCPPLSCLGIACPRLSGHHVFFGERALSSAGITISKRRNRLNPDIVEALQVLKGRAGSACGRISRFGRRRQRQYI
jgi:hypothetical protein